MSILRSALFIDFDNIYIGLKNTDAEAARRFSEIPMRWLEWLERKLERPDGASHRRVLVRRCYLNPQSFGDFRPYFIRAGFEVVDTPALTGQGKTSADIHLALDLIDALGHSTCFDEFLLFSGDADFTPVLLRLRKHDRRSAVLAVGPAAAAYKAACDYVIDQDIFMEQALGLEEARPQALPVSAPRPAQRDLLQRIGYRVREMAALVGGVPAADLPSIYKQFPEFRDGDSWLGFFSLRRMTEAVVQATPGLDLVEETESQWWLRHVDGVAVPLAAEQNTSTNDSPLLTEVRSCVLQSVRGSEAAVDLASLAHRLVENLGERVRADWQAAGSFKRFLEGLELDGLKISAVMPGYIYDPKMHQEPEDARQERTSGQSELAEFARGVAELTDLPFLPPAHYCVVLRETAREINENGFNLTQTSKAVRDRANGKEVPVARSHVSFILKGIAFAGHALDHGDQTPEALGESLYKNATELCRRAQRELSEEDEAKLRQWLLGGLDDDVSEAGAENSGEATSPITPSLTKAASPG